MWSGSLAFDVHWHEQALDDLKSLDRDIAGKIVDRVKYHLSEKPGDLGKSLKGVLKGLHRYRIGDYRIIFAIDRSENSISVLHIAHRKDVYRR
jgi:mRNA interferase RelE/StbE